MLHDPRRENRALVDLRMLGVLRRIGGELVEGVEHGIEDGALILRNLRQRVRKRHRVVAPYEAHGGVVRHPEDVFGIFCFKRQVAIDRDFLQEELEDRLFGTSVADAAIEIEFSQRIKLPCFVVVLKIAEPPRELVHESESLLEVVGVEREASSAVEEQTRFRAWIERGGLRLRVGAVCRQLIEVRNARELRQLMGQVAHRAGLVDARAACELAAAEQVDGGLHELDAARGEGLALAEVLELHVVAHEVRNVLLAAEHVRDRLEEDGAHLVVRRLHFRRAQE